MNDIHELLVSMGGWPFSVYSKADGRVLRAGAIGDMQDLPLQATAGEDWLPEILNEDTHYVLEGKATERPAISLPARVDLAVGELHALTVPNGTKARLRGQDWAPVEGDLTLISIEPVKQIVFVQPPWPYREAQIIVQVN